MIVIPTSWEGMPVRTRRLPPDFLLQSLDIYTFPKLKTWFIHFKFLCQSDDPAVIWCNRSIVNDTAGHISSDVLMTRVGSVRDANRSLCALFVYTMAVHPKSLVALRSGESAYISVTGHGHDDRCGPLVDTDWRCNPKDFTKPTSLTGLQRRRPCDSSQLGCLSILIPDRYKRLWISVI